LRDLTHSRITLLRERRYRQPNSEGVLKDANINLASVVTDILVPLKSGTG
jgi:hypothetical protein